MSFVVVSKLGCYRVYEIMYSLNTLDGTTNGVYKIRSPWKLINTPVLHAWLLGGFCRALNLVDPLVAPSNLYRKSVHSLCRDGVDTFSVCALKSLLTSPYYAFLSTYSLPKTWLEVVTVIFT